MFKQRAGEHAATLVRSGMVCGLGSGSTAIFATRHIAERLRAGDLKDIIAIAYLNPACLRLGVQDALHVGAQLLPFGQHLVEFMLSQPTWLRDTRR